MGELGSESCPARTAEGESKGPKAKMKKMFKLKLFVFRLIKFRHNRGAAIISKHTLYFKKNESTSQTCSKQKMKKKKLKHELVQ